MPLNWTKEFHVHTHALAIAIEAILTQGWDNKVDLPIYYASRLLNQAKRNYITTKKEVVAMIYVVKKIKHYLLANHFIFFVDHQALVYMVNRPLISSCIARWLLLLLKFNFEVIYKPRKEHVVLDYLSRLETKGGLPLMT